MANEHDYSAIGEKVLAGGEWVKPISKKKMLVRDPSTGGVITEVTECGAEDVDRAVTAAKKASHVWWKLPAVEKANLMHKIAARLRSQDHEIALLMTRETGKPLIESIDCIEWVAACFDYYAEVGRSSYGLSLPPVAHHQFNYTIKEPYGVVAAIAPFNFPLLLMSWKVAPALMAGNTLVCKPPHQNPLSNLLMARVYDVLPPGVINVISGGAETGSELIEHPDIDLVAFTGSTEVGRNIAARCGALLKKVNLELGGIDPLIVFEDSDLDVAVRGAAWARLLNAGQVCTSSKRFYVEDRVHDEFVKKLVSYVKTLKVGSPLSTDTDMGPLITESARKKVAEQVQKLKEEGARLKLGGHSFQPQGLKGFFWEPTIFTDVKHGGVATTEEIFGPVINIIRVKDREEAIALANDSRYGLGAVIYTKSLETAMMASENIKAGTFWINDPLTDNDAGPFGGMRWSGVGRELGEEGLNAFREPKHVHLDYKQEVKQFWFPYSNRPVQK